MPIAFAAVTAALTATLSGCSGVGAASGGTIRVGVQAIPSDYVWQAKDWGSPFGLRTVNSTSPSAAREVQQLLSGQVDVIDSGSGPVLSAVDRSPSKLLVIGMRQSGGKRDELMVPENSTARSVADLKGKKIAVPAGTGAAIAFSLYLKSQHLTNGDFTFVNMEPSAEIEALKEGDVAGAVGWEPTPSLGVVSHAAKVLTNFSAVTTDPDFIVTTRAFEKAHKSTLVKFLAATMAMDNFVKDHPSQAAQMAVKEADQGGASASVQAFVRAFGLTNLSPMISAKNIADLAPVESYMREAGELPGKVAFTRDVDTSYLNQAQKQQ